MRLLTPQGELKSLVYTFPAHSAGSAPDVKTISPSEGYLISASCSAPATTRGQVFVKLFIQRGIGSGDTALGHVLFEDYVDSDDLVGYPQSPNRSSLDGQGFTHAVSITPPVAGADVMQVVPAGVRWKLKAFVCFFGTSVAVANRLPQLFVKDPSAVQVMQVPAFQVQAAAVQGSFTWGGGLTSTNALNAQSMGAPIDLILRPGWSFGTLTINLQAADQFTAPSALVEEYISL